MLMNVIGYGALIFSFISFVVACPRAYMGDEKRSDKNEWYCLAWLAIAVLALKPIEIKNLHQTSCGQGIAVFTPMKDAPNGMGLTSIPICN